MKSGREAEAHENRVKGAAVCFGHAGVSKIRRPTITADVKRLSGERGAKLFRLSSGWYRIAPIHMLFRLWTSAWR